MRDLAYSRAESVVENVVDTDRLFACSLLTEGSRCRSGFKSKGRWRFTYMHLDIHLLWMRNDHRLQLLNIDLTRGPRIDVLAGG